jgi:hypothetical protein
MSVLASAAWWQLFSPLRVVLFERNWWFSTCPYQELNLGEKTSGWKQDAWRIGVGLIAGSIARPW